MSWIYIKKYSMNFDQTLQRHGRGIELSKNIKILVTFDLHSRSRDPRWPPNTFSKVKFGPKTTHNSANFLSNSKIFVLFCCWRPVLHFGWKSNTNNGSMCLLAPEKRPSYTTFTTMENCIVAIFNWEWWENWSKLSQCHPWYLCNDI